MDISDFGEGGSGRQDIWDLLQGGSPRSATVKIEDVGHDSMHRKDAEGFHHWVVLRMTVKQP